MTGAGWVADSLAALMLATVAYCAARLLLAPVRRRVSDPDVEVAHIAMGLCMAGMLVPRAAVLPRPVWAALFALAALWFAARWLWQRPLGEPARGLEHGLLPHLLESGAMLYMLLAPASSAVLATARYPAVGLALVLGLVAYAVLQADAGRPLAAVAAAAGDSGADYRVAFLPRSQRALSDPRVEACCGVVMCVAMAYMLVLML